MAVFLPPVVAALSKVAAKDEGRYSMAGVRVLDPGDGTYRLEATDGKRAVILRGYNLDADRVPEMPACEESVRASDGIVPSRDWVDGFKMVPASRHNGPAIPLALVLRQDDVCMATLGAQRQCRLLEGRFPNFANVLPEKPAKVSFAVNPVLMIELLQVVKAIVGDEPKVMIHFWHPDQPVGLTCSTPDHGGVFFDGLIMPLS